MKRLLLVAAAFSLAACGAPYLRSGDSLARSGNWEDALVEYQRAADEHPSSDAAMRKAARARSEVAAILTRRGAEANAAGRLGEAASLWQRAVELAPEEARSTCAAARAIEANSAALEYFADVALAEGRHDEALAASSALLAIDPSNAARIGKELEARRAFAHELDDEAESLGRRNLPGAALVTEVRALDLDPLAPDAFARGNGFRRALKDRARAGAPKLAFDDHGYHALGVAIGAALPKTAAKSASTLRVTVVSFEKSESSIDGVDEHRNEEPAATDPVPNPAVLAQKKLIAELSVSLAQQQKALRSATTKDKAAGLSAARAVDRTRGELEAARGQLAALPETVAPPPPEPTFTIPWHETTRRVTATVRFEVIEPDFAEPIVLEATHEVVATDRSHPADPRHHISAAPIVLPPLDAMVADLGAKFGEAGDTIERARARRIERTLATGRELAAKHADPEALDCFVDVLFMAGPDALPDDAMAFVARSLQHRRVADLLASK